MIKQEVSFPELPFPSYQSKIALPASGRVAAIQSAADSSEAENDVVSANTLAPAAFPAATPLTGVLDYQAIFRFDTQHLCSLQENIRGRFFMLNIQSAHYAVEGFFRYANLSEVDLDFGRVALEATAIFNPLARHFSINSGTPLKGVSFPLPIHRRLHKCSGFVPFQFKGNVVLLSHSSPRYLFSPIPVNSRKSSGDTLEPFSWNISTPALQI